MCFSWYSLEHNDYRCYDPATHRLRIACHVEFLEHQLYYSTLSPASSHHELP